MMMIDEPSQPQQQQHHWGNEIVLKVGDEIAFSNYEENVVYRLQLVWKEKEGLQSGVPVIEISSKLEDCAYMDTKRQFKLSESTPMWTREDCL